MGLTTLPPLCAECLESLAASTSWPLRACPVSVGIDFEDGTQSILHLFMFNGSLVSHSVVENNLHREN